MVRVKVCIFVKFIFSVILISAVFFETVYEIYAAGEISAKGFVVLEAKTGRIIFGQNEHEKLPMASTTKIMTAIIALEQGNINEYFEVSPEAVKTEGSSMGLKAGDKVSLYSLCCGMLLSSGNDAANAAAIHIAGSIDKFVDLMNEKAAELGMKNTSFGSPSGLDIGEHYSTAYDMALLARYAMQNEVFSSICSEYELQVEFGNPPAKHTLTNHNKLLLWKDWIKGVKTGFTKKAGRCLVSYAEKDDVELICVTLNCPDDWNTHKTVYEEWFDKLKVREIKVGEGLRADLINGMQGYIEAEGETFKIALTDEEYANLEIKTYFERYKYAPVYEGEKLGYAKVSIGSEEILEFDLTAKETVSEKESVSMIIIWFERLLKALFSI